MPLTYFRNIRGRSEGSAHKSSFESDGLAVCGRAEPKREKGISSRTVSCFETGSIIREEEFLGSFLHDTKEMEMEFSTFSENELVEIHEVKEKRDYHTPNGPMKQTCQYKRHTSGNSSVKTRWKLTYSS